MNRIQSLSVSVACCWLSAVWKKKSLSFEFYLLSIDAVLAARVHYEKYHRETWGESRLSISNDVVVYVRCSNKSKIACGHKTTTGFPPNAKDWWQEKVTGRIHKITLSLCVLVLCILWRHSSILICFIHSSHRFNMSGTLLVNTALIVCNKCLCSTFFLGLAISYLGLSWGWDAFP